MNKIILQKYIAESGCCSRRKAEELIRLGQVFVNGKKAELGQRASEEDLVKINKQIIKVRQEKIYIILNKPKGYISTNRKFKNEKNIFELLPKKYHNLKIAGRLDKDSRGLLLLTNDGDYIQEITHPRFEHEKKYLVKIKMQKSKIKIDEKLKKEMIYSFGKGVDIGDGDGIVKAKNIKTITDNEFEIILSEGKKRQIRRMFKVLGLEVLNLQRISIGKINLEDLKEGEWKKITIN